ncbi:MAG: tetratricopeptide (TPR) repeat protein [Parasphingorhabdus sp.]|jgi:tetratricopeptide (TPR) repeat protein
MNQTQPDPRQLASSMQYAELLVSQDRLMSAASSLEKVLKHHPLDTQVLHNLGELCRLTGRLDEALLHLKQCLVVNNKAADTWHCLGLVQHQMGNVSHAIESYRCALNITPEDVNSLINLSAILAEHNCLAESNRLLEQAIELDTTTPNAWVNLAANYFEQNEIQQCLDTLRQGLKANPDNCILLSQLSANLRHIGDITEANKICKRLMLHAEETSHRLECIHVLEQQQEFTQALRLVQIWTNNESVDLDLTLAHIRLLKHCGDDELARSKLSVLLKIYPDNTNVQLTAADFFLRNREFTKAKTLLTNATNQQPDNAAVYFNLGVLEQIQGNYQSGAKHLSKSLWINPLFGRAAYNLALNQNHSETATLTKVINEGLANPATNLDSRINFHFAAATLLDRQEQFEQAFSHLESGNNLLHRCAPFNKKSYEQRIDALIRSFPCHGIDIEMCQTDERPMPLFIIGMPRSGSTLVESIVGNHPKVTSMGESSVLKKSIINGETRDNLYRPIIPDLMGSIRQHWQASVHLLVGSAQLACDKMLGNFLLLGHIAQLFPGCKVIHCVRNPIATGLSCYMQNFDHGIRFGNHLGDFAFAYRIYRKLIQHWKRCLPIHLIDIQYENLVSDTENETRRLLNRCELEFDDKCLQRQRHGFHTASFQQVSRPVYQSSISNWKNYSSHLKCLEPLIQQEVLA